jgi:hypothetical protein
MGKKLAEKQETECMYRKLEKMGAKYRGEIVEE